MPLTPQEVLQKMTERDVTEYSRLLDEQLNTATYVGAEISVDNPISAEVLTQLAKIYYNAGWDIFISTLPADTNGKMVTTITLKPHQLANEPMPTVASEQKQEHGEPQQEPQRAEQ